MEDDILATTCGLLTKLSNAEKTSLASKVVLYGNIESDVERNPLPLKVSSFLRIADPDPVLTEVCFSCKCEEMK